MDIWALVMLVAGGLFAGGSATFAWSRVPIRRRMPPSGFVSDFAQTLHWTDKVQPALLVIAIASAGAFAYTADGSARVFAALAALGFVLTLVGSVAFLVPLQRRIIATPLQGTDAIEEMRAQWFRGNLGRSVLATASFIITVAAATVAA